MPFGGWFDQYYERIYRPAVETAGLECRRADDLYRPSTIVSDIWTYTKHAKVILADLTEKNPNVLYELGLAHALAKPVVIVTASMDDIPFDLRALRIIQYDRKLPDWGEILRRAITLSIEEVLSSPLRAVLPAFLEVDDSAEQGPVLEYEKELLQLRQDVNLLRRLVEKGRPDASYSGIPFMFDEAHEMNRQHAEALIMNGLLSGISEATLYRDLEAKGVPRDWITEKLRELSRESRS
jgi:hypothetical protein